MKFSQYCRYPNKDTLETVFSRVMNDYGLCASTTGLESDLHFALCAPQTSHCSSRVFHNKQCLTSFKNSMALKLKPSEMVR